MEKNVKKYDNFQKIENKNKNIFDNYTFLGKISEISQIRHLSLDKLKILADEIRDYIIKVVSKNGGHLASSLGVIDITVALFYVFDIEKDKIIWDVGHQAYAYKILTKRAKEFSSLRKFGGISGFPKISESKYDAFGTGHSSTSISSALGFAVARDLKGTDEKIIAVIGDGAMTNGLAFEGLNNSGNLNKNMLVVLNDNEMFISTRVGALGKYFAKILSGGFVRNLDLTIANLSKKLKISHDIIKTLFNRAKTIFTPGMLFEELGFTYFGPVDGHDIKTLIEILEKIKTMSGPILLHIVTKKGKGYNFAENNPIKFHGISSFDEITGEANKLAGKNKTYTQIFSDTLVKEAKKNDRIIAITAAMCEGTGLLEFAKKFPARYFDVGIAESHAITFAAGVAANGMKPVCAIYSTFLQRGFDQIIHDVCLQNLPVIFAIDRAGIVGEDGSTHQGIFDISFLRIIPNLILMAPKDENELSVMLRTALSINKPCAIRYPRGAGIGVKVNFEAPLLEIGKAEIVYREGDICVITIGNMFNVAKNAIDRLKLENINLKLINLRFIKPLDVELIKKCAGQSKVIITVEENILSGGMGSSIRELLADDTKKIFSIGLPDKFIEHGSQDKIRDIYNLSGEKLYSIFKQIYLNNY
ncbi:MAG: 1-deoxy-D-xylulose-5-phosphate synthase [Elusimicrobiota bacterium]|nr:1-deoxy-D-xylulose-5-phosphate synthase [Elusimicrobiota bacterium]